jgi:hypothetical protein
MADPICKVGDRTDFQFAISEWHNGHYHSRTATLVGDVIDVIPGKVEYGVQMEHQYVIQSNNERYRVHESNVATPYGPWDDI